MGVESKERELRKKKMGLGLRFGYTAMAWTWVRCMGTQVWCGK